jgi:hypothetical protein
VIDWLQERQDARERGVELEYQEIPIEPEPTLADAQRTTTENATEMLIEAIEKELENNDTSERVLSPVLDDNQSEVPSTPQGADGDRTAGGRPEHRKPAVKKAKKKKAKGKSK